MRMRMESSPEKWIMIRCPLFVLYFIMLDYICLNIFVWGALVIAISAAIVFFVRESAIKNSRAIDCTT